MLADQVSWTGETISSTGPVLEQERRVGLRQRPTSCPEVATGTDEQRVAMRLCMELSLLGATVRTCVSSLRSIVCGHSAVLHHSCGHQSTLYVSAKEVCCSLATRREGDGPTRLLRMVCVSCDRPMLEPFDRPSDLAVQEISFAISSSPSTSNTHPSLFPSIFSICPTCLSTGKESTGLSRSSRRSRQGTSVLRPIELVA